MTLTKASTTVLQDSSITEAKLASNSVTASKLGVDLELLRVDNMFHAIDLRPWPQTSDFLPAAGTTDRTFNNILVNNIPAISLVGFEVACLNNEGKYYYEARFMAYQPGGSYIVARNGTYRGRSTTQYSTDGTTENFISGVFEWDDQDQILNFGHRVQTDCFGGERNWDEADAIYSEVKLWRLDD